MKRVLLIVSVVLLVSCSKKDDECACNSQGKIVVTKQEDYDGDLKAFCDEEEEKLKADGAAGYCILIE